MPLIPEVEAWEAGLKAEEAYWGGRTLTYTITELVRKLGIDKLKYTGKGVRVAVLDSGIWDGHIMLRGAVVDRFMVAPGTITGYFHGTGVASVIAGRGVNHPIYGLMRGVAPEASLIDIKVLDDTGMSKSSWLIRGIEEALERKADVINISAGSPVDQGDDHPLTRMIRDYVDVPVVCAAGNIPGPGKVYMPANGSRAIAVGSINIENRHSYYSSQGPVKVGIKPDLACYGGESGGGRRPERIIVAWGPGSIYQAKAGTSYSAPIVTGIIALMIQRARERGIHKLPRERIMEILARSSIDLEMPGKDNLTGFGLPVAERAIATI